MFKPSIMVIPLTILVFAGPILGSEEEFLPWMEVRIAGPQRNDTGKVVFTARIAGGKFGAVDIEAFGRKFSLTKAQRDSLDGYPLDSIAITHEAGYPRLGGHMVHFKLHKVSVNANQQIVKQQVVISVTKQRGLTVSQPQRQIVKNAAKDGKFQFMQQLSDDDRLTLLKPVMSLNEVEKLWAGKKLHGQACGIVKGGKDGPRSMYRNVYLLRLSGKPEPESMSFAYYQDNHQLFGFSGPGFRYELKNDKFIAVQGPQQAQTKQIQKPFVAKGSHVKVQVHGTLQVTDLLQVGFPVSITQPIGATITTSEMTMPLIFPRNKEIVKRAKKLHGKTVVLEGALKRSMRLESIEERKKRGDLIFAKTISSLPQRPVYYIKVRTIQEAEREEPITLNLPKASAVRMDKTTILFHCEAILVNRTGKVIDVKSDFHSAFDNLSLVVFDANGKRLLQQAYVHHQSPFDFRGRFFALKKGENKKTLVFPVSGLPNGIRELRVLLVGELPDGEYRHMLCSDMVSTVVKSNVP